MQCQICSKNAATVHFTEIVNNRMSELHICDSCAHEKGIQSHQGKSNFWIGDVIAGMIDESAGGDQERVGHIQCSGCGMMFSLFKETGRLGCPECYNAFATQLRPMLRRIHGATRHLGKSPVRDQARLTQRRESSRLHDELDRAIEREDFEQAATLRDRLRQMEAGPAEGVQ